MTKSGKHCGKRRNYCSFCLLLSLFSKNPAAAEASESVYMRERVKNIVTKVEIDHNEQFLLLHQYFNSLFLIIILLFTEVFSYFFPNCFLLKIWAFLRENQHYWLCDPDQPKHAAQAYLDWHFLPPVDFLFQESFLYTVPLSPETEGVGLDQSVQTDLDRYITQMP